MPGIIEKAPGNLEQKDWDRISSALKGSKCLPVVDALRRRGNEPTEARIILPNRFVHSGHENVNNHLRERGVPFRLSRIGRWSRGAARKDRKLAFVRWDEDK